LQSLQDLLTLWVNNALNFKKLQLTALQSVIGWKLATDSVIAALIGCGISVVTNN